ncbi:equilibrative nucleoside transporter 1-like [Anthonomus grandis grandis]|uniref:equilibrative nucleoside transporter 1-like n=1 Tax=Anthonomus grandis grandis TaxID=2921223 RepID=UPI002165A1CE|nr:equilibrative nucleoside transporter 1-like [Anthonomus grandis grandis]
MIDVPNVKDKYYITYGMFYLLGILTSIPNYFFITASRYWMYKLRPLPDPSEVMPGPGPPKERNVLQASFPSCYFITIQISLVVFIFLTATCSKKLPPPDKRISAALWCSLVFYVVNLIFCQLVTDKFQLAFFFLVLLIVCCLGVCGAVILISLFEMIRKFPSQYYAAILTGQPLSAAISAVIQILTIIYTDNPISQGTIFFTIGSLLVLCTIAVYWFSKRNSQYFIYNTGNDISVDVQQPRERKHLVLHIWRVVKSSPAQVKVCLGALVLVVMVSSTVYPGFMSLVVAQESTGRTDNEWAEIYFVPVITFLVGSLFDLIGRLLAAKLQRPKNLMVITLIAVARFAFIPLMILCNAQPRMRIPVVFYDLPYVIFTIAFAFSNGHMINLCVLLVSEKAESVEEKRDITIVAVILAVLAAALSSFFSLILVYSL